MKIAIKRAKKTGMLGKASYTLTVRAELTDDEKDIVNKNSLADEILVWHDKTGVANSLAGAIINTMRDTVLTVESFHRGTTFTCKNVAELIGIEDEVRQASLNLRAFIEMARTFGGEEVIDVDDEFEALVRSKQKNIA